jgi:hypothetical protein
VKAGRPSDERPPPAREQRGLALAFLSMLPMFLAYEVGRAADPGAGRNTSELVLVQLAELFGSAADPLRRVALLLCGAWAFTAVFRRELGLVPRLARVALEGAGAALLLGPLLVVLVHALGLAAEPSELSSGAPAAAPSLARAARILGAAAWEETAFRLGLFSLAWLVLFRAASFLAGTRAGGAWTGALAELGAALVSSAAFAAFHLEAFTSWLGEGGEPFRAAVFTWRFAAGMLLVGLFRWRGLGVAAWAHGLFNLAMFLGAGPDVFLALSHG